MVYSGVVHYLSEEKKNKKEFGLIIGVLTHMKLILLFLPMLIISQQGLTAYGDTGYNLNRIKRELAAPYNSQKMVIKGNKYFFKNPTNATLVLDDSKEPINVITNYNLLEQTFDVFDENQIYKLLPSKIQKVIFPNIEFTSINNKFYEVIESNEDFSLLADTYLEIYFPEYTPGIQEKPDPKYRKRNSVFLYYNNRFNYVERRKNFLVSMFSKNMTKDINTFIKKNKISPRDNDELKTLFLKFHSSLNR